MPVPSPSRNRKQAAHAPSLEGPLRAFPDDRAPTSHGLPGAHYLPPRCLGPSPWPLQLRVFIYEMEITRVLHPTPLPPPSPLGDWKE